MISISLKQAESSVNLLLNTKNPEKIIFRDFLITKNYTIRVPIFYRQNAHSRLILYC
jgi:hypothetical protein